MKQVTAHPQMYMRMFLLQHLHRLKIKKVSSSLKTIYNQVIFPQHKPLIPGGGGRKKGKKGKALGTRLGEGVGSGQK